MEQTERSQAQKDLELYIKSKAQAESKAQEEQTAFLNSLK